MFNDCEKPAAAKDEECEGKSLARRTQAEEKVCRQLIQSKSYQQSKRLNLK